MAQPTERIPLWQQLAVVPLCGPAQLDRIELLAKAILAGADHESVRQQTASLDRAAPPQDQVVVIFNRTKHRVAVRYGDDLTIVPLSGGQSVGGAAAGGSAAEPAPDPSLVPEPSRDPTLAPNPSPHPCAAIDSPAPELNAVGGEHTTNDQPVLKPDGALQSHSAVERPAQDLNTAADGPVTGPEGSLQPHAVEERADEPTPQSSTVTSSDEAIPESPRQPTDCDTSTAKQRQWKQFVQEAGGTLRALVRWAAKFGDTLPGRDALLEEHRSAFGYNRGISQPIMRKLRAKKIADSKKGSALRKSARGGVPTHKRRT